MNPPLGTGEALAVLSKAWTWRERIGTRCKQPLQRARALPVADAGLVATLVVQGYLRCREVK